MVFFFQVVWVDVDSLLFSGLVSQLLLELQVIIFVQVSIGFIKVGIMFNYVYQWNIGIILVYGNGFMFNGLGVEVFEYIVMVI